LLPWPGRVSGSALLRPDEVWPVYATGGAQLEALPYADGAQVPAGGVLLQLQVPELQTRRKNLLARVERLRWQAAPAGLDAEAHNRLLLQEEQLSAAQSELASLDTELRDDAPQAPYAGQLRLSDPDLQVGQWLSRKEKIGQLLRADGRWVVETWLDEAAVQRVAVGSSALFICDSAVGPALTLQVLAIDRDATRVLPRPELAAHLGGHILTREKAGQLVPESAIYHVTLGLAPDSPLPPALAAHSWRGKVTIHAHWEAPAWPYLRQALAVLVREAGF
jgi:putative peptide zinc metalloprotease protein